MTQDTREDRAQGALLGLAVGDALGVPLVGMGREQARIKHATVASFLGGGLFLLPPGTTTARVAMVRASAVSLLEASPSPEQTLEGYLRVLAEESPGLGEATRGALERIREGATPADAAAAAHEALERRTAGVGPALRAVPFALRYLDDPAELRRRVLADAALTHADSRAGAAALVLATWVAVHVEGEDDPERALDRVRERMAERVDLPDVLPAAAAVRGLPVRPTAFAPDVLHAVARHVVPATSARRAIVGAVNEAGAATAIGAAVGAVAGARFGASALPDEWTGLLNGASTWRVLATRLLARARA